MYNIAWAGLPVTPTSSCGTAVIQAWNNSLSKDRPLLCFWLLNLIANFLSFFVVVVEMLLSIPVRLEILINFSNVLYFQRDTGSGFIYAHCENFSNCRCTSKNDIICSSLLRIVCFMTRRQNKIYQEKITRCCQESKGGLALNQAECLFLTKPIKSWHCNKCCMCTGRFGKKSMSNKMS